MSGPSENPFEAPRAAEPTDLSRGDLVEVLKGHTLDFGELFQIAIDVTRRNFPALLVLWALYYVPLHLYNEFALGFGLQRTDAVEGKLGVALAWTFGESIFSTFSMGAHIAFIGGVLRGQPISIGSAYGLAFSRLLSLIAAALLMGIIVGLWSILFLVPGIIAWVRMSLCLHAVMLDGAAGGDSLGESRKLVEGHWWPMFGLACFGFMFAFVSGVVVSAAAGVLTQVPFSGIVVQSIFSVGTLFASIMIVARYVNYEAMFRGAE